MRLVIESSDIATALYDYVRFKDRKRARCDCNENIKDIEEFSRTLGKEIHENMEFHYWDDSLNKPLSEYLSKIKIPNFKNNTIDELIENIKANSGHSFCKYEHIYIDPVLESRGVPQDNINLFDDWFSTICKKVSRSSKK